MFFPLFIRFVSYPVFVLIALEDLFQVDLISLFQSKSPNLYCLNGDAILSLGVSSLFVL